LHRIDDNGISFLAVQKAFCRLRLAVAEGLQGRAGSLRMRQGIPAFRGIRQGRGRLCRLWEALRSRVNIICGIVKLFFIAGMIAVEIIYSNFASQSKHQKNIIS
jgi:hypothetical protein